MTTSSWDSLQIAREFSECATLRDIIHRIETDFSTKGEVICEIHINGMLLDENGESRFAGKPRGEIHDISVRSDRPDLLIMQALRSANDYIPQLEASCLTTAEAFRGPDLGVAQRAFTEMLEGCSWLVETITHVRGAASGIGTPIGDIDRWFEAEKTINRVVRELSEGYAASDFVLVADLLEYELTGALQIWGEALAAERDRRA
jgi:hypothetical protein